MNHQKPQPSHIFGLLSLLVIAVMLVSCTGPATEAPAVVEATQGTAPTEAPVVQPTEPQPAEPPTEAPPAEPTAVDFSPDIPDPEQPVEITFATWTHTEANDAWDIMAQEFTKIHPNITIKFIDVPAEEMYDKLLTEVAANNPPDAAYVDTPVVGDFALNKALVNLDDYIAKSTVIDLNDYIKAFLDNGKVEGSVYGLPIDGETTGLYYRKDRFEEAGLDPTHPPETWEEFKEYAEKLTKPEENKYGFIQFAPEAAYYFYPWLWQAGGDVLSPDDPNDVIYDSPEGQKAANFYVDLVQYSPPDYLNSNSWDGRVAFANGDVAMYVAGAWFAGTLMDEFPEATEFWSAASLPQDERCATTFAGDYLVVFEDSENKDAAFKWIEFISAPENMRLVNLGTPDNPSTLLPPRKSILEDESIYENRPFMKGFADDMACTFVSDVVQPRFYEIEEILNEKLGEAFYGQIDGATAVTEAAAAAEEALATPQ